MRRWDIFCKVVDNYGDIGVSWRLARQLADEHQVAVTLWVDDLRSFSKLCPVVSTVSLVQQVGSVLVRRWNGKPDEHAIDADRVGVLDEIDIADVVIEAFACELPAFYLSAMSRRPVPPVWINLEYLSAEDWVNDCHLLESPHPTMGLKKRFFFPGFTPDTGGLIREQNLFAQRDAFDRQAQDAFWQSIGIPSRCSDDNVDDADADSSELRISLFCYDNPQMPQLLKLWSEGSRPVRVLAAPGAATMQLGKYFESHFTPGKTLQRGAFTAHALPFLSHSDYDRLLWASDINFVRGEDSFVRAQWAANPFVWNIYPQIEGVHIEKMNAFLARYLGNFESPAVVTSLWTHWNSDIQCDGMELASAWRSFVGNRSGLAKHGKQWANQLDQQGDLANNLCCFVRGHLGNSLRTSSRTAN